MWRWIILAHKYRGDFPNPGSEGERVSAGLPGQCSVHPASELRDRRNRPVLPRRSRQCSPGNSCPELSRDKTLRGRTRLRRPIFGRSFQRIDHLYPRNDRRDQSCREFLGNGASWTGRHRLDHRDGASCQSDSLADDRPADWCLAPIHSDRRRRGDHRLVSSGATAARTTRFGCWPSRISPIRSDASIRCERFVRQLGGKEL